MSTSATTPVGAKRMQSRSERKRISAKAKEAGVNNTQSTNAESNSKQSKDNAFANKKNVMWVLLSGAMALTFIVMLFLPNTGMGNGMIATYSAMLWCGFFGASLWRYRSTNGWTGFAYGSVIGFTLQFVSQLI